jgi:hypothetical protein
LSALCLRTGTPLWVLDIRYVDVKVITGADRTLRTSIRDLWMKLQTQLLSPDQYAVGPAKFISHRLIGRYALE